MTLCVYNKAEGEACRDPCPYGYEKSRKSHNCPFKHGDINFDPHFKINETLSIHGGRLDELEDKLQMILENLDTGEKQE